MLMKRDIFLSGSAAVFFCASTPAFAQQAGDRVPDTYVCTFVPGPLSVTFEANSAANSVGGRILRTYTNVLDGFAIRIAEPALEVMLQNNPNIASCEQSYYVGLPTGEAGAAARGAPRPGSPGGGGGGKPGGGGGSSGEVLPWGIEAVGRGTPSGATVWVVDTGVEIGNTDLNLIDSKEFLTSETIGGNANSVDDLNGHGTHVAGTIAAKENGVGVIGVAPGAPIKSVRVLDAVGIAPDTDVLAGLDYVYANDGPGDVVNLSLTADPGSTVLDAAVKNLAASGTFVVMAAGNDSASVDENSVSPGNNNGPYLFTVSAVDQRNSLASFSNYGPSVDFAEPGVKIVSLARGGGTTSKDGTSMAAPHLSGILAVTGGAVGNGGAIKRDKDADTDVLGILP